MAEAIDHTGALPRVMGASAIASLVTGAVFYVVVILLSRADDPIGLAYLIGFGMVAVFWIPAAIVGTLVTAIILTLIPTRPLLPVQLVAFGVIAMVGSLLGGSETVGEVLALTALGMIYGAASAITYQRSSKVKPTNG